MFLEYMICHFSYGDNWTKNLASVCVCKTHVYTCLSKIMRNLCALNP
uniref:Uncharacterized protein n=1 Tax=Rhizophora mucronata TaxID=61149 RepID=A0A2P2MX62_RHIMU